MVSGMSVCFSAALKKSRHFSGFTCGDVLPSTLSDCVEGGLLGAASVTIERRG